MPLFGGKKDKKITVTIDFELPKARYEIMQFKKLHNHKTLHI